MSAADTYVHPSSFQYGMVVVGEGGEENNIPIMFNNKELTESPTPVKEQQQPSFQKRRKPRKSIAPKKLLLGAPAPNSLRRSSRKREHELEDTTKAQSLNMLNVVIPSDPNRESYQIPMKNDNAATITNEECDGDHIRRVSHSPPSSSALQGAFGTSPSYDDYSSPVPNHHGTATTGPMMHLGTTPLTTTTTATTQKKSPPKSILRSKKKPRLNLNNVSMAVDVDGAIAATGHSPQEQDGRIGDAQLDALVASTMGLNVGEDLVLSPTAKASAGTIEAGLALLKKVEQEDTESDFDAICIQNRMSLLFPAEKYDSIKALPCILPRLVACFTLYRDEEIAGGKDCDGDSASSSSNPKTPKVTTRRRKRSLDGKTKSIQEIAPIRDLLTSLVDLELSLLSIKGADANLWSKTTKGSVDDDRPSPHSRHRKVMFQTFDTMDGSAVLCPPTDTLEGSHQEHEQCIQRLKKVVQSVQDLGRWTISDVKTTLQSFATYLDVSFKLRYHDKICALTLPSIGGMRSYPTSRISKAAAAYSRDVESLLAHLSPIESMAALTHQSINVSQSSPPPSPPLVWEERLGDASAQLTRYWLRTLTNSVPERYEKNRSNSRAWKRRLDDLIQMRERPGKEEDEDPTSSLVSNALSHIYQYLGANPSEWQKRLSDHLAAFSSSDKNSSFSDVCNSEICQTGVGKGRKPAQPLSDAEWSHVEESFESASSLVACYNRAVFIHQLLSIVSDLKLKNHWAKTVQSASRHLTDLSARDSDLLASDMAILQPEDAHLSLLGWDVEVLQKSLQDVLIEPLSDEIGQIEKNLVSSASAFRLGGKKKSKHFTAHLPKVGELEEHWVEHLEPSLAFCTMTLRSDIEEE